jgi:hypothetical protein
MRLTRQMLISSGACKAGLVSFDARVQGDDGYEWTEAEALRVYIRSPRFLQWLERLGLVPMLEVPNLPSVAIRKELLKTPAERRAEKVKAQRVA